MSVGDNKEFFNLVLNTSPQQARALLDIITPSQVKALQEIAENLREVPLTDDILEFIEKRKILLITLSSKKTSIKQATLLLRKNKHQVISILQQIREPLKLMLQ